MSEASLLVASQTGATSVQPAGAVKTVPELQPLSLAVIEATRRSPAVVEVGLSVTVLVVTSAPGVVLWTRVTPAALGAGFTGGGTFLTGGTAVAMATLNAQMNRIRPLMPRRKRPGTEAIWVT